MNEQTSGWWCPHCQRIVDGSEVTFGERHEECGYAVGDPPTEPGVIICPDCLGATELYVPNSIPDSEPWVRCELCEGKGEFKPIESLRKAQEDCLNMYDDLLCAQMERDQLKDHVAELERKLKP